METLRRVVAAMLARAVVEALRRGGLAGIEAELEVALVEWVASTVDLACLLLAGALRAREARRGERNS